MYALKLQTYSHASLLLVHINSTLSCADLEIFFPGGGSDGFLSLSGGPRYILGNL